MLRSGSDEAPIYKRVILKLTGEIFRKNGDNLNEEAAVAAAKEIKSVHDLGVEVAVVFGGGNIVRGRNFIGSRVLEPASADYMGMLATVINGLLLHDAVAYCGMDARLMTALEIKKVAEPYIQKRARKHLDKKRVVIMVGGIGEPGYTTDNTALSRAVDINAQAIIKGTKVDGVFSDDPKEKPDAVFLPEVRIEDMIRNPSLMGIFEETALIRNKKYKIPIHVINIFTEGNLRRLLLGEKVGSHIIF